MNALNLYINRDRSRAAATSKMERFVIIVKALHLGCCSSPRPASDKDTNFMLSLKQPKKLYRKLTSSRFISNFKNIKKPGTYKCSGKRCKICQNYLNGTNKFTFSNGQVWEIRREIDCH